MPSASRNRSRLLATPAVICFWKKLEIRVRDIADKFDGVMGVAILDLIDGRNFLHNTESVFPAASSIKIAVLVE
jgi:beta-lactamase class A